MEDLLRLLSFLFGAVTLCWVFYVMVLKPEPTMKDLAVLSGIAVLNTFTRRS